MIVWGGHNLADYVNTGGRYNYGTDGWTAYQHHECARWPIGAHGSVDER